MGILNTLRGLFTPEKRNYSDVWRDLKDYSIFSSSSSGQNVSSRTATAINAVYVSAKILGEAISSYTFDVVNNTGTTRNSVNDPAKRVFSQMANEKYGITAFNYWNTVMLHLCTHGNHFSLIERDGNDQITALYPLLPYDVEVFTDEKIGIYYQVNGHDAPYLSSEILHFKGMGWQGIIGMNPIHEQREVIGLAQKQGKYALGIYGSKPSGYIKTDQDLEPEDLRSVGKFWDGQTFNGQTTKTPVLGLGMEFKTIPLSPADIEYINSRNLTDRNIYAMYRIPPTLAQDYERATFANAEQQDLVLSKYTLLPYIRNFEQEIESKILRPTRSAKFNMNSILRADIKSRSEALSMLWDRGVISDNEWRAYEDMNPKEDGGKYYVPLNFIEEGTEPQDNGETDI